MPRASRPLAQKDYRRLAEFRHALRQFLAFSEAAAEEAGLTPVQHQALLAIKGMPGLRPVNIGDLAAWLGVRPHSAAELVERLVRQRLLQKRSAPADKRRTELRLTAKAESKLTALSRAHRAELGRLAQVLRPL